MFDFKNIDLVSFYVNVVICENMVCSYCIVIEYYECYWGGFLFVILIVIVQYFSYYVDKLILSILVYWLVVFVKWYYEYGFLDFMKVLLVKKVMKGI